MPDNDENNPEIPEPMGSTIGNREQERKALEALKACSEDGQRRVVGAWLRKKAGQSLNEALKMVIGIMEEVHNGRLGRG